MDRHFKFTLQVLWKFIMCYLVICYGYILHIFIFLALVAALSNTFNVESFPHVINLYAISLGVLGAILLVFLVSLSLKFFNLNFFSFLNIDSLFFFYFFYLTFIALIGWYRNFILNSIFKTA
jgi:hypothetical protein